MTIDAARKILGSKYDKISDGEIQQMIDTLKTIANIAIDTTLKMSPQERKKLEKEFNRKRRT